MHNAELASLFRKTQLKYNKNRPIFKEFLPMKIGLYFYHEMPCGNGTGTRPLRSYLHFAYIGIMRFIGRI